MAVIRVHKTADYTVMSNSHFREYGLSFKAKGILSQMLSLPDNWDYSIVGLTKLAKDGKESVMSGLAELEEFGYLKRTRTLDEKGRFAGYDYDIFEVPQKENPYAENPNTDKTNTDKPYAENQQQSNNNQSITYISNTDKSSIKDIYNSEFDILWKMYPRKQGKTAALKSYIKARKNGTTFEEVEQGIVNYCRHIKAKETSTEYVKHGSTWFSNEGWTDEYDYTPRLPKPAPAPKQSASGNIFLEIAHDEGIY